ncbi:tyrosine-type recombinase/integrase [Lysinibacillus pakistanensis]|uniref:tyrosine-type recombinase/integrase n=1 Tax=Lysinibacillus pakistanensis TaxID=759811 RepID=UPI003D27A7A3
MRKKGYLMRDDFNDDTVFLTLQQAYDYFYSAKKAENIREKTLVTYVEHFRFFTNWLEITDYKLKSVNDLSGEIVRAYINYMREEHYNFKTGKRGLSVQTINARIRFLKTWYSFLKKESLIKDNIMLTVNYLKIDEKKVTLLTKDEMQTLFEVPDQKFYPQWRDYVLFHVLYDSSLRISEAVNLDVMDIDLMRKQTILPADKAKDRRYRTIPISNITVQLLIKLIDENKKVFKDAEAVFLNWYGERMAVDTFRRNLKRYLKKAGIHKEYSCHDFRRQAITDMLKNGASVFMVQAIAGHSQISTTKKYVHFDDETIKIQHDLYSPLNQMVYKRRR